MEGVRPISDLISRQTAIDAVHKNYDTILDFKSDGHTVADNFIERLSHIPMVQEAIRKAMDKMPTIEPERKRGKWIPCSKRLPEDDTEVFVYLFDRPSPYIAWVTDSCWFTEEFQVEKENYPKAWMPLPEPYRAERRTE